MCVAMKIVGADAAYAQRNGLLSVPVRFRSQRSLMAVLGGVSTFDLAIAHLVDRRDLQLTPLTGLDIGNRGRNK